MKFGYLRKHCLGHQLVQGNILADEVLQRASVDASNSVYWLKKVYG